MKKISIISVVFLLFFSSCIKDYSTLTEFVVENNSEYELKIQVSNFEAEFFNSVDTTFIIGVGSQISCKYELDGEDAVYDSPFGYSSGPLTIHFNDTVFNRFSKNSPSQYNLLLLENYSEDKIKKGLYKFTYTITNQDFQEALKENANVNNN